jgi:hypothetical protein
MHMRDWNNYRNQLSAAVTGFGILSPETVAVSINAGAALVYSMCTLDAFEAANEEQASA